MSEILLTSGRSFPSNVPFYSESKQFNLAIASDWADFIGQVYPRVSRLPLAWGEMQ